MEVLPKQPPMASSSNTYEDEDDDFGDGPSRPLSTVKTYDEESSMARLPGTSLLRSVSSRKVQLPSSNHESVKSLQSDHTYDFDNDLSGRSRASLSEFDEFGEDTAGSPLATTKKKLSTSSVRPSAIAASNSGNGGRVPAWKLRQKALREDNPLPPKNIIATHQKKTVAGKNWPPPKPGDRKDTEINTNNSTSNNGTSSTYSFRNRIINNNTNTTNSSNGVKRSPVRNLRKTSSANSSSGHYRNGSSSGGSGEAPASWFQKLTTKKETAEEKEKRLKSEALIEKQTSTRWGKDILEEDSSEEPEDTQDDPFPATKEDSKAKNIKETTKDEKEPNEENDAASQTKKDELEDEEDESDTVKKVKSLIEKSFGSALISTVKKDKEKKREAANAEKKKEEGDTESDSTEEPQKGRENRWALMGSAAMTSVRNMQRGWKNEDGDKTEKTNTESAIAEEDSEANDDEAEDKFGEEVPGANRRSSLWRNRGAVAITSVRNAWGSSASRLEMEYGDKSSSRDEEDEEDSKSVQSDPGQNKKQPNNKNLLSSIANFVKHTRAKFDPEVWNDPEVQESLAAIEKLRKKIHDSRGEHKNKTRRRERQIENSIMQQKNFLARKLARQIYGYKKDPFHACIKDIYEKEILIIVHEVTSLGGDDDSQIEKDDIDELLDSKKFDFDYKGEDDNKSNEGSLGAFFGKQESKKKRPGESSSLAGSILDGAGSLVGKPINRDSLLPLETRLLRAQHNEWMTDHQMEMARGFQQKSVEHLYDLMPQLRKEHEKLWAIPQSAVDAKVKELQARNDKLKEAYEAHIQAQEKILEIYRERYVPSVHEDEEEKEDGQEVKPETEEIENNEGEDTFGTPPSSPTKNLFNRPGMFARNLSNSVRNLLGPKNEETTREDEKDDDNSEGNNSNDSKDGFDLSSPIGDLSKNKFILSFGSQDGSKAASGILANFNSPPLGDEPSTNKSEKVSLKSDKESLQESLDSAAAAWTVPKMDKASLPESLAEKRAKRAAARLASRPDAATSSTTTSTSATKSTSVASTSRSELLRRARKAREESASALGSSASGKTATATPSSPVRSSSGSLKSSTSSRKELSMKDLMAKAGDSRRKLMENDSRMERLTHKKNQLRKTSPLNSPEASSVTSARSRMSDERRLRIVRELRQDDLSTSSHHSLHERKSRTSRSLKKSADMADDEEEPVSEHLEDVDEFGSEEQ